jgi:transposase
MATLQKKVSRGHAYWQIVESRRVNGKPRPIVLVHLGSAQTLLRRLQQGGGRPLKARVLQFGALAALWNVAQELGLVRLIDQQVPKRAQGLSCGQYLLLATLNRCVAASSKASLYEWYRHTVLQRLLPAPKSLLASQRFWDHMGSVDEGAIGAIEQQLARRVIERYHIQLSTLVFDATNFDTYIDTQTPGELAQRGHAKSKRKDLRLVGLALLVSTDFHIPLLWRLYPGNQNDARMFGSVTESLVARYRQLASECEQITLVFDGGNTSAANMARVDRGPYHFITSLTLTHHADLLGVPLSSYESFSDPRLKGTTAYRSSKEVWGKQRTVVVTHSEELLAGQLAGIGVALGKKRRALRLLRGKLRRSQRPGAGGKGYTRESVQRHLKELTSGQYIGQILRSELTETEGKLDFRFWTDERAFEQLRRTRLGKRILCTDNEQWSTEQIILGSRAQYHVENAFKQMKDPHWVSFSPAFHWTDQKLRVHAFYCVLALLLCSIAQRKAAQGGIPLSINALLESLSGITEVINLYGAPEPGVQGRYRAEYVLSERSPIQDKLCRLLEVYRHARAGTPADQQPPT